MARILFINKSTFGGPTHSLLKLLPIVMSEHHIIVILNQETDLASELRSLGIPIIIHPIRYRNIPFIFRLLRQEKIDLVYANSFTSSAWRVLLAAKLAGCKFIWHIREILNVDKINPYQVRKRVRFADQVIAVSEACRQSVKVISSTTAVTVVYNGVEVNDFEFAQNYARVYARKQFSLQSDDIILVSVGTLTPRKNQYDIIVAVSQLIKENPKIHLYLLGDCNPEYVHVLNSLIDKLGIQSNIHFSGFRRDIPQILCGSDILVHTALVDPHPRSVLESMAANLPVVAYNVDGVGETIIDNENGFLVPVGDKEFLERRISQLINDPSLRQRLGQNGHRTVKDRFSAENTANKVLQVINQVISGEVVN